MLLKFIMYQLLYFKSLTSIKIGIIGVYYHFQQYFCYIVAVIFIWWRKVN